MQVTKVKQKEKVRGQVGLFRLMAQGQEFHTKVWKLLFYKIPFSTQPETH
jgi:hypothetical protein